jgi:heavy metal sensor kinase
MSIRTKLTIWYTSILALVLLAFGVGVYAILTWSMVSQLRSTLEGTAKSVPGIFSSLGVTPKSDPRICTIIPQLDPFRASEVYVVIAAYDGRVLCTSSNLFQENKDPATYAMLDKKTFEDVKTLPKDVFEQRFSTVREPNSPALEVVTQPLRDQTNNLIAYMQVAATRETIDTAQRTLFITLVSLSALGLVISSVIGVFLARRALRPVDRITQTALNIYRAESLDQRVPEPKTNDEVGRLSSAFNEMLDRLSRLFNAQQRLVADVSHEMRTPLTVIRGNVDLLTTLGCADHESLDALKRESDRMTRMVGDLLLLSQADSGALSIQLQPTALAPIVSDVERSGVMLSGGKLRVAAEVNANLTVQADSDRLKQVLLNLVDNAIKHTPAGGEVRIEATQSINGFARVSVSDTGAGIPEADLQHVFERFYRVDKSRSRERGGSGLGLSIAHTIVEAHKGRMSVSSQVGIGTTFDVYIPLTNAFLVTNGVAEPSANGATHGKRATTAA